MSPSATLEAIDAAAATLGMRFIPLPGARLSLFGPRLTGPSFNLVVVPDEDGAAVTFRVRPVVAHPLSARPILTEVIDGWHATRRWPRVRISEIHETDDPLLLVEGDVHLLGVASMTVEGLADALDQVVASAREFWDTCPVLTTGPDEIGARIADDLEQMLRLVDDRRLDRL
ncbi:MAG TPA: hypothetical protein VGO60_08385 [Iamia sp.]|jgi:hypothetical protein|nr:hypothetical protein [Iamia sp.]